MSTMPDNLLVAVVNKVNANDIKGKKIETLTYEINSHLERDQTDVKSWKETIEERITFVENRASSQKAPQTT